MNTKLILVCVLGWVLAGCVSQQQPMSFGMPTSQFNRLSNDQKTQVIQQYNMRQQQQANNEMLASTVGAATNSAFALSGSSGVGKTFTQESKSPVQQDCHPTAGGTSCTTSQSSSATGVSASVDPGALAQTILNIAQRGSL